jgi:hypothetical protein
MNETNLWIIDGIVEKMKELKESKEYFKKVTNFTRDRVFTFETVFFLISDLPRKSLGIEIQKGLEAINKLLQKSINGTKSGFGKARQKIDPELFEVICKHLLILYYGSDNKRGLKKWKGFRLTAVDGSIGDLVDTPANRKTFGVQKNQYGVTVQGRIMIRYDVLNKIITNSYLGALSVGEANIAKDWVKEMEKTDLCIYDRLYPGSSLQYIHHYFHIPYVMRCKTGHNERVKAFVESGKKDLTEEWLLTETSITELRKRGMMVNNKTRISVRMLRIVLDDGEIEVLVTSLIDKKKYPHKIFKDLYFKRWGVETNIGFLKNVLQIELASGRNVETIFQDFYATIFRANVQTLIEENCENQLEKISRTRKYDYQINHTVAAGNLKGKFCVLFLGKNPLDEYLKLVDIFIRNIEPIRPGRMVVRNKRSQKISGKYKPMPNYKKAV